MFITRLIWDEDIDEENVLKHTIVHPAWDDIHEAFLRLDGQTYPSLFLTGDDQLVSFPTLSVHGGPDEYTADLTRVPANGRGDFECLQLIDPSRFYKPDAHTWRGIGKCYHNYEVETRYLTPNTELILNMIRHFAYTGHWYPQAPFIVEAEDEEGEWRQYTEQP